MKFYRYRIVPSLWEIKRMKVAGRTFGMCIHTGHWHHSVAWRKIR